MESESEQLLVESSQKYGGVPETEEDGKEQDIDEIIKKKGKPGCLQVLIQLATLYLFITNSYNFVFSFFTGNDPPWTCTVQNSSEFCRSHFGEIISIDDELFTKRCQLGRGEWHYVTGKRFSFVTEFDLVCSKTSVAALISASYYIGGVLGALATGPISDTYGRLMVLIFCSIFTTASAIASSYVTCIWQLITLYIIRGAGSTGVFYTTIVYQSEFAGPQYRSLSSNILILGTSLSFLLIDLVASYIRDWRELSTYAALPSLLALLIFSFTPESPRWLLSKGRKEDAEKVMKKIVAMSGNLDFEINLKCSETTLKKHTYWDLVREVRVLKISLSVVMIWFTLPVVYYAIALQSSTLGGDMYKAFALSSCADIPSYFLSIYFANKLGRKKTTLGGLLISGILMGSMLLVPRDLSYKFILNITISMSARFFVCSSFCSMYTWSLELFPTPLRSQALSLCGIADRLGMFIVPFIIRVLQSIVFYLPNIVMCSFAFSTVLIGLLLPETNQMPTKECYEDFFTNSDRDLLLSPTGSSSRETESD